NAKVGQFAEIANDLGCTPAQLAIAWCSHNPHVSTVITGATSPKQLEENLAAIEVLAKMDESVVSRIEGIFGAV
ncbi:MAG: aldo/keto reductase, partial [Candidatus Eisenbacteria bacterium]